MDYPGKVITKTQVTPTQTSASGNWTLDDQAAAIKNNNWPVALVPNPISKSLRFNSADSAYLNRTPASAGNRRTWTWSGWVKVSSITSGNLLFSAYSGSTADGFRFRHFSTGTYPDALMFYLDDTTGGGVYTNAVFRDVSAWYHIVLAVDTTQATAANRIKLYVNGTEQTFASATYPTQNYDCRINNNVLHNIGAVNGGTFCNGYMTEINFIDGQALTPSDFGLTNPQTGQWIPKKYTGTYGTNGFYLNFKDATSTTTLGYDYSGNANNWTTNNFSVTAGSGNDSLTDVPTPWVAYNTTGDVGGVVRGNYCTFNPLQHNSVTEINGNLDTNAFSLDAWTIGTVAVASGKWYAELIMTSFTVAAPSEFGIARVELMRSGGAWTTGATLMNNAITYDYSGGKRVLGTFSAYGSTWTTNDVIGIAFDADAGTVTFYKNGVSQGAISQSLAGYSWAVVAANQRGGGCTCTVNANFGQRPFAYTPPTGFRSLCTTNLPATAIGFGLTNQADDYFNTVLWTGNGTSQTITGVGFQPDFVWGKGRSFADFHVLEDAVRGATKSLSSNLTTAEVTRSTALTAFTSDGFSVGSDTLLNYNANTFVAWNWKAGGTGVSNTAGTITSTVSASTTAGFSIVTYTGNATSGATVGHGLGVAPNLIIVRNRTASAQNWQVYSSVLGATKRLFLDLTDAENTYIGAWNNTAPTSTVFSLGNATDVNGNTNNFVAYCFAAVAGYSAFGSYTGNGSTDGPFVYLGFRPRYVMIKRTDSAGYDWYIYDTVRQTYNLTDTILFADLSNAESTSSVSVLDILSNGFKLRGSSGGTNSGNFIYAAFAEFPFQFANAR